MKNFYTASEAQKRLSMDKNGFYYLVRKGTIKGITMPGKKQSVYPRIDIDRLAASIKTLVEQYDRETSMFRPATREDLPEEYAMDVSLYGKETAPIETRIAKLERNPDSDFVLRNAGEVVGHISFHPVLSDPTPECDWTGNIGYVHQVAKDHHSDLSGYQVYACGAPVMVESALRDFTAHHGLPAEEFYADSFTSEADLVNAV